jgi:outer membrane protein TolC
MSRAHRAGWWRTGFFAAWLCGGLTAGVVSAQSGTSGPAAPDKAKEKVAVQLDDRLPRPRPLDLDGKTKGAPDADLEAQLPQPPPSILPAELNSIDLGCVLRLAGVQNPEILIARQRVAVAQAQRMLAYALALPNLNAGVNYDAHTGPLQQSSGNILKVNREALYFGAGAGAVAAGTVGIPGIQYNLNLSEGIFGALIVRQTVRVREFENLAVRNQMLLRVADAYMELLRAEGRLAIGIRNREEARDIALKQASFLRRGAGNKADADRARTQYARRIDEVVKFEGEVLVASARLAALLNIPPEVQLHAIDGWVVPTPIIPDPFPLHDLLAIAMGQRPELAARRAAIREAILALNAARVLPLSPTIIAGYSAGSFGGGSNLIGQPGGFQGFAEARFGSFAPRDDIDVIMFWTAQNMGVGNFARMRVRRNEARLAELELVRELNRVRYEVATAYAQTHARFNQIGIAQQGLEAGTLGYQEDAARQFRGGPRLALPIELLNNFNLMADARLQLLDTIVDYDKAQFALYVALGQPPAKYLALPVPSNLVPPPSPAPPLPCCRPDDSSGLTLMPPTPDTKAGEPDPRAPRGPEVPPAPRR